MGWPAGNDPLYSNRRPTRLANHASTVVQNVSPIIHNGLDSINLCLSSPAQQVFTEQLGAMENYCRGCHVNFATECVVSQRFQAAARSR